MNPNLFNMEFEKAVLGNVLLDQELDLSNAPIEAFFYEELKEIHKTITKLKFEGKPLEYVSIELQGYEGIVSACMDSGVVTANFTHNCNVLKSLYASRQMFELGENIKLVKPSNIHKYSNRIKIRLDEIEMIIGHEGLKTINPSEINLDIIKKNGYVSTGFESVDYKLNDLEPGRVTLVSGKSFEGKTTFVRTIIANAINSDNKVLWVMGENNHFDELRRLYQIVIGRKKEYFDTKIDNKRMVKIPKPEIKKALNRWHKDKLIIINKSEAKLKNQNELLELIEKELKINKHNLIIIDNLMSILISKSFEKNEAQSNFMQLLCDLSKIYNTHILLVLHPKKDSEYNKPDNDSISGTSDLPNKADNIIFITKSGVEDQALGISGHIHITKNKRWGDVGKTPIWFDKETESFAEIKDEKNLINNFHIEKFIEKSIEIDKKFIVNEEVEPF